MRARRPARTAGPVVVLVVALAVVAALALAWASPARAATAAELRALADDVAVSWAPHANREGFIDPVNGWPRDGYGAELIGYGLLVAGARRHDSGLVASGVRAVDLARRTVTLERGTFRPLGLALAYRFARRALAGDPAFRRVRPRWERALRGIPPASVIGLVSRCGRSLRCFHNHEVVEAAVNLALLRTGLTSRAPGVRLADRRALSRLVALEVGVQVPAAFGRSGRSTWPGISAPLGLLSDTGSWPLAYDALSLAMLGDVVADLGRRAPGAARRVLARGTRTLAALMAPDGSVAYLGRRQEAAWAVAAAVAAGETAAASGGRPAAVARLRALSDRAVGRLRSDYRRAAWGLSPVPRRLAPVPRGLSPTNGYGGIDQESVQVNGLTILMLEIAADAAIGARVAPAPRLPADDDGSLVIPGQGGLAVVRTGRSWFAVHARPLERGFPGYADLRGDVGLVALKRLADDGRWRDVLPLRPLAASSLVDSAGPVLIRGGRRYLPYGARITVRGGTVRLRGGFRSARGVWARRGVTFRYTSERRGGVRLTFPARRGDVLEYTSFLAREPIRRTSVGVADADTDIATTPPPRRERLLGRSLASCCQPRLRAAALRLRVPRGGPVLIAVRPR